MNAVLSDQSLIERALLRSEPTVFDEIGVQQLLVHAKAMGASDVYIKTNARVTARIHGRLYRLTRRTLYATEVGSIAGYLYGGPNAEVQLKRGMDLDNAYTFRLNRSDSLRFRWNATGAEIDGSFGISIILRELPEIPPAIDKEDLGDDLYGALYPDDGIVMVCGPTGSGKSTLLAGMVRDIAENPDSHCHIITYESPVEFVYDKVEKPTTEIESTSIPDHLPNFAAAIRNSLRRDPDIIVVGEMRDGETIGAAILASQTGHVVYGTAHSTSVGATFTRTMQSLPKNEQQGMLGGLIDSLRLIICQELVQSTDGKRVALREYLSFGESERRALLTAAMRDPAGVPSVAQQLTRERGQTKLMHARKLFAAGRIKEDVVLRFELAEQTARAQVSLLAGEGE
ncbi:type IV pilus twitching motility protein PilT [Xanthomonas campestris]|uniref:type IV pilus twitching motility protein PilT n=1 Tax=Xanthomonas campestris TaxID=339 RepID=UPI001C84E9A8|nr:ATPase, T2SS/T4P/T4SS family [Xanthomonas campestris]MCF8869887.1 Flp pilus assembly complex ATPase component TadA [Xanthomonas campestris pv. campestris]